MGRERRATGGCCRDGFGGAVEEAGVGWDGGRAESYGGGGWECGFYGWVGGAEGVC